MSFVNSSSFFSVPFSSSLRTDLSQSASTAIKSARSFFAGASQAISKSSEILSSPASNSNPSQLIDSTANNTTPLPAMAPNTTSIHPSPDVTSPNFSHSTTFSITSSHFTPPPAPSPSTTTSIAVIQAAPLKTSTITTQPNITLSSPIAFTSTDTKNGMRITTTPPLVTLVSTSTERNGAMATVTNVVANPPSISGEQITTHTGLLANQGALAGVSVAAGVAAACIIITLALCIRRRLKIKRRNRWIASMQRQRPTSLASDPFQDSNDIYTKSPYMTNRDDIQWGDQAGGSSLVSQQPMTQKRSSIGHYDLPSYPDLHPFIPSSSKPVESNGLTLGFPDSSEIIPSTTMYRHPAAPSTPSIYPASLPPNDDGHSEANHVVEPVVVALPPRPPRSHLRESAKNLKQVPLTPPASHSSQSSTPSPIAEPRPQDVLFRRTILDVRSRSPSPPK